VPEVAIRTYWYDICSDVKLLIRITGYRQVRWRRWINHTYPKKELTHALRFGTCLHIMWGPRKTFPTLWTGTTRERRAMERARQRTQLNSVCQGADIHDRETIHVLVPLCRAVNLLKLALETEITPVTESVRCMLLLQVVNAHRNTKLS